MLNTLHQECAWLKKRQADRKILKDHKQQLWAKARALKEKLVVAQKSASDTESRLTADVAAAREAMRDQLAAKESASKAQIDRLKQQHADEFKRVGDDAEAREATVLAVLRSEAQSVEADLAGQVAGRGQDAMAASKLAADLRRQHEEELTNVRDEAASARERVEALSRENEELAGKHTAASADVERLQADRDKEQQTHTNDVEALQKAAAAQETEHRAQLAEVQAELERMKQAHSASSAEAQQVAAALEEKDKEIEATKKRLKAGSDDFLLKTTQHGDALTAQTLKADELTAKLAAAMREKEAQTKRAEALELGAAKASEANDKLRDELRTGEDAWRKERIQLEATHAADSTRKRELEEEASASNASHAQELQTIKDGAERERVAADAAHHAEQKRLQDEATRLQRELTAAQAAASLVQAHNDVVAAAPEPPAADDNGSDMDLCEVSSLAQAARLAAPKQAPVIHGSSRRRTGGSASKAAAMRPAEPPAAQTLPMPPVAPLKPTVDVPAKAKLVADAPAKAKPVADATAKSKPVAAAPPKSKVSDVPPPVASKVQPKAKSPKPARPMPPEPERVVIPVCSRGTRIPAFPHPGSRRVSEWPAIEPLM